MWWWIIRKSFPNVKSLCWRQLKRVKSFQPHSGFGASTFFGSHAPLWLKTPLKEADSKARTLSPRRSVHPNIFYSGLKRWVCITSLQKLLHQQVVHRFFKIATQVYEVVLCGHDGYILPVSNWLLEIPRRGGPWTAANLKIIFAVAACWQFPFCCPSSQLTFFWRSHIPKCAGQWRRVFFPPPSSRGESKMCKRFCARGLRTGRTLPRRPRAQKRLHILTPSLPLLVFNMPQSATGT